VPVTVDGAEDAIAFAIVFHSWQIATGNVPNAFAHSTTQP
jgi:hypothetical protein